jgi:hypothetical protein
MRIHAWSLIPSKLNDPIKDDAWPIQKIDSLVLKCVYHCYSMLIIFRSWCYNIWINFAIDFIRGGGRPSAARA